VVVLAVAVVEEVHTDQAKEAFPTVEGDEKEVVEHRA
jgi:hypothetical protein